MLATATALRAELARKRPRSITQGYPRELRSRAGAWLLEQHSAGQPWKSLADQIGISSSAANIWARAAAESPAGPARFLPVVVSSNAERIDQATGSAILHTPSGYRVSGLGLDELLTMLRDLE